MSYCLNPVCSAPQNSADEVCQSCGTALKLCDRYQALKPIGQGGFGRTFLAVDLSESMKPRCVIKQLYPQQQGAEMRAKASDLFRQEAQQLLTAGQYPSIPKFLDYFEQEGYQYLVQEFIEGQNLAEVLATGRTFTESEVTGLLETMLETVDFLHHHQIIHRDIKPANIIQTLNGRFVLVDLGAAKLITGTALGQTGTVIGSAEYVAPEQLRGKAIFASDLYSLGATCVTLLTGMSPFSLFDTSTGSWEWRDYLSAPVGDRLGKILDRLLIGPTKLRYGSVDEVLRELEVKKPDLVEERAIDSLHQEVFVQTKEKTAELGIEPTHLGEIVEKRGDRQNTKRLIKIMLFLGVSLMWPIGALIIANLNSTTLAPEAPSPAAAPVEQAQIPEGTMLRGQYNLSDLIKPDYTRPISPYKVIKDLPLFSSMVVKDNNGVIFGRKMTGKQLMISNLDINTGVANTIKLTGQYKNDYPSKESFEQLAVHNQFLIHSIIRFNNKENKQEQELKIWNMDNNQVVPIESPNLVNSMHTFPDRNGLIYDMSKSGELTVLKILKNGTFLTSKKLRINKDQGTSLPIVTPDLRGLFAFEAPRNSSRENNKNNVVHRDMNTGQESYIFSASDIGIPMFNGPMAQSRLFTMSQDPAKPFLVITSDEGILGIGTPSVTAKLSKLNPYTRGTSGYQSVDLKQVGMSDGSIFHVYDVKSKKVLYTFSRLGRISHVAISPDSNTLIVLEGNTATPLEDTNSRKYGSTLTVWDLKTGRLLRRMFVIKHTNIEEMSFNESNLAGSTSPTLAFTPDSKKLILGIPSLGFDGTPLPKAVESGISIWNVDELRNP